MKKGYLDKLSSRKFIVAVIVLIVVASSKKLGLDALTIRILVLAAISYIATEGTLDLGSIIRSMYKKD